MSRPARYACLFVLGLAPSLALASQPSAPSPRTVAAPRSLPLSESEAGELTRRSLEVLDRDAEAFGLTNGSWDAEVTRVHADAFANHRHVRVQQYLEDVPVFEGQGILHYDPTGTLVSVTDAFVRGLDGLDTAPGFTVGDAYDIALAATGLRQLELEDATVRLYVYVTPADGPHLAWQVRFVSDHDKDEVHGLNPVAPLLFVDAHDGTILARWDDLRHSSAAVTGTSSYYGSGIALPGSLSGGSYYLEDPSRHIGVFDNANKTSAAVHYSDSDGNFTASSQAPGVDALLALRETYDYYLADQGIAGMNGSGGITYSSAQDGSGKVITGRARYGRSYNNAYWSGSYFVLGSGDGRSFSSLTSIDVVAHEYTHGVSGYWANFTYSGESGAIDEAFSDIMGTMIEWKAAADGYTTGDWKIGEDCMTPGTAGDALRYMDNPHLATNYGYTADDDPDHYSERYTGRSDNSGVHINSGIVNKMFYLLSEGGSHHLGGSVEGIGKTKAARIMFVAMADYMTSGTTMSQARSAMLRAASALYGGSGAEYAAVGQAWTLVGVS